MELRTKLPHCHLLIKRVRRRAGRTGTERPEGQRTLAAPMADLVAFLTSRLLEIYASLVWASADLALPDSGYSVG
jgi:hypothetical protein